MDIKRRKKRPVKKPKVNIEFISTNCIPIDLALSNKGRRGGFARGRIANIVGDGSTGKTLLALETAAWCFYNIRRVKSRIFGKVRRPVIVYNNVEGVMDFPLESMFGTKFAKSIEWIRISKAEALGRDLSRRVKKLDKGDFLLYIVDSWDGVKPEEESERYDKEVKDDKTISDGFGLSKQKYAHEFFRNLTDDIYGEDYVTDYDYKLDQKDVTIFITSQVRHKINATKFEKQTYRIGGKAFDFWTHQVIWLYKAGKLEDRSEGKKSVYGIKVRSVVERNKVTPPWKEARFPIVFNHGIDELGSIVDYLYGPQSKNYSFEGIKKARKEDFIKEIIANDLDDELKQKLVEEWNKAEEKSAEKHRRRSKYEDNS
jgi:recombination protein RecA